MSNTAQDMSDTAAQLGATPKGVELLIQGMGDALTDSMVERLAGNAGNILEVLDRLNDDDTREAVLCLLDELSKLHRSGGLVGLFELLGLLGAARGALTDSIVERLAVFTEHMVDNMANEEVAKLAGCAHEAMLESGEEVAKSPPEGGFMNTLRLLSSPETQSSLRFLVGVSQRLQDKMC